MIEKIKNYFLEDKRIFAKGVCREKLFFVFLIGCVIGCYYEQILNLITYYLRYRVVYWETRRGVIYGPLSPIYGFGAMLMVYLFCGKEHKWYQTFIYGSLFGGILEYITSFLQELVIGTVSWDYSDKFLNINGRTTIPFMLCWGLMALIFCKSIYPLVSDFIEKIPYNLGKFLYKVLSLYMLIDMTISWTALFRQTMRHAEKAPLTIIGKIYDRVYTDERLRKAFTNMVMR